MPYFSICIPAYKQVDFFKRSLDSIAIQQFSDFEVVVTDDSPDQTLKSICAEYENRFKINYFHNEKQLGSPENWNEAIRKANGDWIKILHHDDWFSDSNSLTEFYNLTLQNPKADFHFCATRIVNQGTAPEMGSPNHLINAPIDEQLHSLAKDPFQLFYWNFIGPPSSTLFRRKLNMYFDQSVYYVVDIDFYIRQLKLNPEFSYSPKPLINNTANHPEQVTAQSMRPETQLGEYIYLYSKFKRGSFPEKSALRFFYSLFLKYGIRSESDLRTLSLQLPNPKWIFKLLLFYLRVKHKKF